LENILFEVNQDPEKLMTKFQLKDVYDNTNMNIYQKTAEVFRTVPGDENFIFITNNFNFIVFDLRTYPIEGKLYQLKSLKGDFSVRKKSK